MKIQYMSDLHLEFGAKRKFRISPDADILILAGDIYTKPASLHKFLKKLLKERRVPILFTPGNHEYYGHHLGDAIYSEWRNAVIESGDWCYCLNNQSILIGKILFTGTTLYSDLSNPQEALEVSYCLNDFRIVSGMTVGVWQKKFLASKEYLTFALSILAQGKHKEWPKPRATVIFSHFTPLRCAELTDPQFFGSLTNAGFASDLSELILEHQPDVWIYGHNHYNKDFQLGKTRLVTNQLGYYHEQLPFNDEALIEI